MEMWTESQRKARPPISKLRRLAIAARIITLISLAIALGIMKTNRPSGKDSIFIDYKKISSYKYMVATLVAGLAYTLLQTPFAAYYAIRGKRLINHLFFLHFEFYGDKVILCILATGVGASFGATTDLKNLLTSKHDQDLLDEFFNMAYVSAGFLFIGFISSAYSSVLSSSATLPPEE